MFGHSSTARNRYACFNFLTETQLLSGSREIGSHTYRFLDFLFDVRIGNWSRVA